MAGDSVMHGVVHLLICQIGVYLALLLAASAVHKGMRWAHTKRVVHEFAGVPRSAAPAAAAAAALGESLAALLLFVPAFRRTGALLAALIFGAYLALMLRAIARGQRDVDCGCSFGPTRHPLGAFDVARNAVLVAFALLVAVSAASGAQAVSAAQALAACALLALYGALDQVMALQPPRRGVVI